MLRNSYIVSAKILGIKKALPSYIDLNLEIKDFLIGVCFASIGSRFDPLTIELIILIITLISHHHSLFFISSKFKFFFHLFLQL